MNYVIVTNRDWYRDLPDRLSKQTGASFTLLDRPEQLTLEYLSSVKPRYVFFPHWSHRIPAEIHDTFECVVFHMTDVPFGRGGSPLQNLISRGIYETKITALRCEAELDAGPVYSKRDFSLYGTAQEIFQRAAHVVESMIVELVGSQPTPVPQSGEVVTFKRRKPEEGDLRGLSELEQVFDFIRMLDAEGYPRAFLETEHLIFEFSRASLRPDGVLADVMIRKRLP